LIQIVKVSVCTSGISSYLTRVQGLQNGTQKGTKRSMLLPNM